MKQKYNAPNKVKSLNIINICDLEERVSKILPKGGFDYIYGEAGDEWTLRENIYIPLKKTNSAKDSIGFGKS